MPITQLPSPDLSPLALGGTNLQLLEGLGFSEDGQYLLVKATFLDNGDSSYGLHHGVWLYDIAAQNYSFCLNQLLAGQNGSPATIDVSTAVIAGSGAGLHIVAKSTVQGSDQASLALINFNEVANKNLLGIDLDYQKLALSNDGRFLAIQTISPHLANESLLDSNDTSDIYLLDLDTSHVTRVSQIGGAEVTAPAYLGTLYSENNQLRISFSTDSAFVSTKIDTNSTSSSIAVGSSQTDAYLWSSGYSSIGLTGTPTFSLISQTTNGHASGFVDSAINAITTSKGVLFNSSAIELSGNAQGATETFLKTPESVSNKLVLNGITELTEGATLAGASLDGRYVALLSSSPEVANNTGIQQLIVVDTMTGDWQLVSKNTNLANDIVFNGIISAKGNVAAFTSLADNLTTDIPASFGGSLYLATLSNSNNLPTGSVTITGTAKQNQTLTASHSLADADGLGTISYQWFADGQEISGATANTLKLRQAQVSKVVTVQASYTDLLGTKENVLSAATSSVANTNDLPTGSITITGIATKNQTLTANNTLADADGLGTISYQWFADGQEISGATAATLKLAQAQVSKVVTVQASYTDLLGTKENVLSAATEIVTDVAKVNNLPTGSVTITGTAKQSQTLTASNTLVDADGLGTISYQWFADGQEISGATAATLKLAQAQVSKVVTVQASYTDLLGTKENVLSAATSSVANTNDLPTGSITIAGIATKNQTLTANNTLADADGLGTISYQWFADGQEISGAIAATLKLAQAQVSKVVTVQASYTDLLGTKENVLSAATEIVTDVAKVNNLPTGSVTITGTAKQHQTLTASHSLADADGLGTISYQWFADGQEISGATAATLKLAQAQVSKVVTVQASYTDLLGTKENVLSAATSSVTNTNDLPTGSITITGIATKNQTLTASNTLADADGLGTISYQWFADGQEISGAIAATLKLAQAQVSKVVTVQASYTDLLGTKENVLSAATEIVTDVAKVNNLPTGSVTITGTAKQNQTLTANNTLADADGLGTISYQWFADGQEISGATAATLKLAQAQVNKVVTVQASYTDLLGTKESILSAATSSVANTNDLPTGSITITGIATKNQTLTANNTLADADGLGTISYQWFADGQEISGATAATLKLAQAQVSKVVTVQASYTDLLGTKENVFSAATEIVTDVAKVNNLPTGSVTITGTAKQNQTLTASNTLADADGLGTISYQWFADGQEISGAIAATLKLAQAQVSKVVTVQASYTDLLGTKENVLSAATEIVTDVAKVNNLPTGSVTITGTAKQNQTLTANNTLADADGLGTISYQWFADGQEISGATTTNLFLEQALVGKAIAVQASYLDNYGANENSISLTTKIVENVNDTPLGKVIITGSPFKNQTLMASYSLEDKDGLGPISYQWFANGKPIKDATEISLTLAQTHVRKLITVGASYTDSWGTDEFVLSSATDKISVSDNHLPQGELTISGNPRQNTTLKAVSSLTDADGLGTINYQWFADGQSISDATNNTLFLSQLFVGKAITVSASYTDLSDTTENVISSATSVVIRANQLPSGTVSIVGNAKQNKVLHIKNTLEDSDGLGDFSYQWLADGGSISGATTDTLKLTQKHVNKAITVQVSYTDLLGSNEKVISSATQDIININDKPTGKVIVSGSTIKSETLSVSNTLKDVDGIGNISYQWLANSKVIKNAIATTFTLTNAQVNKTISVQASYTDLLGTNEKVISEATAKVTSVVKLLSTVESSINASDDEHINLSTPNSDHSLTLIGGDTLLTTHLYLF